MRGARGLYSQAHTAGNCCSGILKKGGTRPIAENMEGARRLCPDNTGPSMGGAPCNLLRKKRDASFLAVLLAAF